MHREYTGMTGQESDDEQAPAGSARVTQARAAGVLVIGQIDQKESPKVFFRLGNHLTSRTRPKVPAGQATASTTASQRS